MQHRVIKLPAEQIEPLLRQVTQEAFSESGSPPDDFMGEALILSLERIQDEYAIVMVVC